MRNLSFLSVWILAGCSSVSGPLDWAIPDEFTLGQGSAEYDWTGGHMGSDPAYAYDGEMESTYAALTWDLPGIEKSDGMSRETQRNMALLLDKMVEEEIGEVDDSDLSLPGMTLREGAPSPPWWLPYVFGGGILLFLVFMGLKSRSNGWH